MYNARILQVTIEPMKKTIHHCNEFSFSDLLRTFFLVSYFLSFSLKAKKKLVRKSGMGRNLLVILIKQNISSLSF